MKYIGYTIIFFIAAAIGFTINGWAFSLLWSWFIVSTFGLPEISIPIAIGIAMIVGFLSPTTKEPDFEKTSFLEKMFENLMRSVLKSVISVGFALIVLMFI